MKKTILAVSAAALVIAGAGAGAATAEDGQAKLSKMLEGRVAGKPVSCIAEQVSTRLQVIDQTAIVYDNGRTIYVAKPHDPKSLRAEDILVIKRFGSQICKEDVIQTIDRSTGFMTGIVFLDNFVPYTKK